jgi:hypothetical protein
VASVVQSTANVATNTTGVLDLTLPYETREGNTVVVFAGCGTYITGTDPGPTSCTLGGLAGNFAAVEGASFSASSSAVTTWLDPGCTGGQTAIAASSFTSADTYWLGGAAFEVSGVTGSPLDVAATTEEFTFEGTTAWSVSGSETAQPAEIWLGFVFAAQSVTVTGPSSPWVNTPSLQVGGVLATMGGSRGASAIGVPAYSGTFNEDAQWTASLITLKAVPGSGLLAACFP